MPRLRKMRNSQLRPVGSSPFLAHTRLQGAKVNIAAWIASGLLAAAYLFVGGAKLLKSKERLAENPSTAGAAEALSATSIKR